MLWKIYVCARTLVRTCRTGGYGPELNTWLPWPSINKTCGRLSSFGSKLTNLLPNSQNNPLLIHPSSEHLIITFSGTFVSHSLFTRFLLNTTNSGPNTPIALNIGTTVVVWPFSECWIWYNGTPFSPTAARLGLNVSCMPLSSKFQIWDGTSIIPFDSNSDLYSWNHVSFPPPACSFQMLYS